RRGRCPGRGVAYVTVYCTRTCRSGKPGVECGIWGTLRAQGSRRVSTRHTKACATKAGALLILVTQSTAGVGCARDVDRGAAFLDKGNFSCLIDYEAGAIGDAPVGHEHAVSFGRLARGKIAEEREGKGKLLCKFTQGRDVVGADTEDLCISSVKF